MLKRRWLGVIFLSFAKSVDISAYDFEYARKTSIDPHSLSIRQGAFYFYSRVWLKFSISISVLRPPL